MTATLFGALSPARRRLVELLQRVNFGRLENLRVRDGEPVIDDQLRVISEWKFGAIDNGPRPELRLTDYVLKTQLVEMFQLFAQLDDATIDLLEVKHGLPFRLQLVGALTD